MFNTPNAKDCADGTDTTDKENVTLINLQT